MAGSADLRLYVSAAIFVVSSFLSFAICYYCPLTVWGVGLTLCSFSAAILSRFLVNIELRAKPRAVQRIVDGALKVYTTACFLLFLILSSPHINVSLIVVAGILGAGLLIDLLRVGSVT